MDCVGVQQHQRHQPTNSGGGGNKTATAAAAAMLSVSDNIASTAQTAASTPTSPTAAGGPVSVTAPAAVFPPPDTDQAQFETDKRSVYKHPLFPLLALLFERCELATQSSDPTQSSDAFNMDIQAFVQHQERDRKPFLANEPEVDGLMIKAIQVLRIHLLELEKVQELCKDFCNRYITCLKGKMQSENLLRSDYPTHQSQLIGGGLSGYESNNNMLSRDESGGSESNSPVPAAVQAAITTTTTTTTPAAVLAQATPYQTQQQCTTDTAYNQQQSYSQHLQTQPTAFSTSSDDSGHHLPPHQLCTTSVVHGSTPLGQIGLQTNSNLLLASDNDNSVHSNPMTPHTPSGGAGDDLLDDDDDCLDDCSSSNDYTGATGHMMGGGGQLGAGGGHAGGGSSGSSSRSNKTKRGVLPKQATSVMRSWLFQHLVHPYPTEDEKRGIAAQTNLTLLQVNNWFINARRRILQPMLDASSVTAPTSTTTTSAACQQQQQQQHQDHSDLDVRRHRKKRKLVNSKRFWTASMEDDSCSEDYRAAAENGDDSYSSEEDDIDDLDDDERSGGSQLVIDATVAPSSPHAVPGGTSAGSAEIPVNGHHLMSNRTRTPTHTAK